MNVHSFTREWIFENERKCMTMKVWVWSPGHNRLFFSDLQYILYFTSFNLLFFAGPSWEKDPLWEVWAPANSLVNHVTYNIEYLFTERETEMISERKRQYYKIEKLWYFVFLQTCSLVVPGGLMPALSLTAR